MREGHAVSPLVKRANARASRALESVHANLSLPESPRRRGRPDSPRKSGHHGGFGTDGPAPKADFDELFRVINELLGKPGRLQLSEKSPAEKPAEKYEREWSRGLEGPRVLRTGVRRKVESQIDAYRGSQILRDGLEAAVRGHIAGGQDRGRARARPPSSPSPGRGGATGERRASPPERSPSPERPSTTPGRSDAGGQARGPRPLRRPATAPLLRNFVEENKLRVRDDGNVPYAVRQQDQRKKRATGSRDHRERVRQKHRALLDQRRAHLEALAGARDEKERLDRELRACQQRKQKLADRQAAWLQATCAAARARVLARALREDRRTRRQRQKEKNAAECLSLYQWRKNQIKKQEKLKDLVALVGESLRCWVRRKLTVIRTRNAELLGLFLRMNSDSNKVVRSVRVFHNRMCKIQRTWRSTLAVWQAQRGLLAHQWSQFEETGRVKASAAAKVAERKGAGGGAGPQPGGPGGPGGRGLARRRSMVGLPLGMGGDLAPGAAGGSRQHGLALSKRVPADIKALCIREELGRRRASYLADEQRYSEEIELYRAKEEVEMTRVHFLRLMGLPYRMELEAPPRPVFKLHITQEDMEALQLRATQLWKRSGVAGGGH